MSSVAGGPTGGAQGQGAAAGPAATGSGVDPLDVYAHSIGSIESNNKYSALGPKQNSGDRAYGRYQVMGSNVGPWTQQVLGQAMTPSDFLNNPQAQDAVFKAKFGQSVQQYGNPADAASVWFSGRPIARAGNASDSLGTTVPSYVSKFLAGSRTSVTGCARRARQRSGADCGLGLGWFFGFAIAADQFRRQSCRVSSGVRTASSGFGATDRRWCTGW